MKTKLLRVILFFSVILIIPLFTLFGEKETVSYNENKTLAEFPEFSFSGYKSRSFMNGVSDFFSDHFVLRESFIKAKNLIEKAIGKTAEKEYLPMQAGDVYQTYADVSELQKDFDFKPSTSIVDGLNSFAKWYFEYYGVK